MQSLSVVFTKFMFLIPLIYDEPLTKSSLSSPAGLKIFFFQKFHPVAKLIANSSISLNDR